MQSRRHPTGKPIVERGVQYVRESWHRTRKLPGVFFRGEQWLDRCWLTSSGKLGGNCLPLWVDQGDGGVVGSTKD